MRRMAVLIGLQCLSLGAWCLSAPLLPGHFSLQGGSPKSEGHLRLTSISGDPLNQHIDLCMTAPHSGRPIQNYAIDMTKRLHLVIVSSDFSVFLHEHPRLGPDGHFTLDQRFPAPGVYYLYADGEPEGLDHQVFRFDAVIGSQPPQPKPRILAPTGPTVPAGPYTVQLSRTRLNAGGMDMIDVHILKDGKPARDLRPYLGALAHAVFLNGKDLSYVHVHPMAMNGASMVPVDMHGPGLPDHAVSSPDMMLHVELKEPGTYKLWLQFRGGSQLYVAPFVLIAR
jgi:hypothetical protein